MYEWFVALFVLVVIILVALYIVYLVNQFNVIPPTGNKFVVDRSQISLQNLASGYYLSSVPCGPGAGNCKNNGLSLSPTLSPSTTWTVIAVQGGTGYQLLSTSGYFYRSGSTTLTVDPNNNTPVVFKIATTPPGPVPKPIQLVMADDNTACVYVDAAEALVYPGCGLSNVQINNSWWNLIVQAPPA
jgi:hypothetical protein